MIYKSIFITCKQINFTPFFSVFLVFVLSCGPVEEKNMENPIGQDLVSKVNHPANENSKSFNPEHLLTEHMVYHVEIKDMNEDADWWYSNMRYDDRENFIRMILEAIRSERLTAFLPSLGMPANDPQNALSVEQVDSMLHPRDTVYIEDIETGAIIPTPVELDYENDELIRVTFIEEWYFDPKQVQMQKKVNGLALAHSVYNEDGTLRGYKPLFYVWFNEVNLEKIM